jgi:hypothetical protein
LSDNEWLQSGVATAQQCHARREKRRGTVPGYYGILGAIYQQPIGRTLSIAGQRFILTAGYSYDSRNLREQLIVGEGLSGQAFASGKMLELSCPKTTALNILRAG